jgi:U3 small nucleolar RNA-associated protein 10
VKECLATINRTWTAAVQRGHIATNHQLELLAACVERQAKSAIVKHASMLGEIFLRGMDLRRSVLLDGIESFDGESLRDVEGGLNAVMVQTILKMNDTTFRPIFSKIISRAAARTPKEDARARLLRLTSVYGFMFVFFDDLKVSHGAKPATIVTISLTPYIVDRHKLRELHHGDHHRGLGPGDAER